MRDILKHIASLLCFTLGLIMLLTLSSHFVKSGNKENKTNEYVGMKYDISSETDNTVDVIFLGDSEYTSSFIPIKLWEEYGYTSFNCGIPGQNLSKLYDVLQYSFQYQNPKIVILETDAIFRNLKYSDYAEKKAGKAFPILIYHNNWKQNNADLYKRKHTGKKSYTKGYRFSLQSAPADTYGYMKPSKGTTVIQSAKLDYINKIKKLCDDNSCELILVSTPSTKNWNYSRHNSIAILASELNVKYIDMNLKTKEVPIDWKTDTRDKGDHMNYYGALKVTHYTGELLKSTGKCTDKRDSSDSSEWNKALSNFNASVPKTA